MTAVVLEGRALAAAVREAVRDRAAAVAAARGTPPGIGVLLVSDDPAVAAYARSKRTAAAALGLAHRELRLPARSATAAVVAAIEALQAEPAVDGVIVELPLPPGIDTPRVLAAIDPARDADGVSPISLGRLAAGEPGPRPATPSAVLALLDAAGAELAGAHAVVVGRSRAVGLPAALMLLARDATVTVAHSRTDDLAAVTRRADVLVAAAGVPGLIGPAAVKPGATVVDIGTTWREEGEGGRLVGDVDFEGVREVAGALTPVPGGVGPVTTALLLRTTVELAEARLAPR